MAYTVKKISKLSSVTIRTLHFYEEIGLLKPAYYGSNGYRYYEEKQLLQLQQIMFFKELGFTLKQIQRVLGRSDFDQLTALHSHRRDLNQEKVKIGQLIKTIDKTINHLAGKIKMKDKEFFKGFSEIKFNSKTASEAEILVLDNLKKSKEKHDEAFHENINKKMSELYIKISKFIDEGLDPSTKEVQLLVKEHYSFTQEFHVAEKKVYIALSQLYKEHPEFKKQLDFFHPKLAKFLAEAMVIFAEKNLK